MMPLRISNATRVLAEDQDEYYALAIVDEPHPEDGEPMMTSLWEPTPEERQHIAMGGFVKLSIEGTIHPPVVLTTQAPPDTTDV